MLKQPFSVAIPDETLADLKERLARVRWPDGFANSQWEYGTNLDYLKELVEYWRDEYDWRQHEDAINAFSQYRSTIDGIPIHFIHEPGRGPPTDTVNSEPWLAVDLLGLSQDNPAAERSRCLRRRPGRRV